MPQVAGRADRVGNGNEPVLGTPADRFQKKAIAKSRSRDIFSAAGNPPLWNAGPKAETSPIIGGEYSYIRFCPTDFFCKRNRLQKKSRGQNEDMNIHPLIITSSFGPRMEWADVKLKSVYSRSLGVHIAFARC